MPLHSYADSLPDLDLAQASSFPSRKASSLNVEFSGTTDQDGPALLANVAGDDVRSRNFATGHGAQQGTTLTGDALPCIELHGLRTVHATPR